MMNKTDKAMLTKLGIEVKYFLVRDINKIPIKMVCVGGLEVIDETRDLSNVDDMIKKYGVSENNYVCDEETLLPFKYTETGIDMKHVEGLIKFRDMKTLSKEQSLDYKVIKKEDLESKVVYIHESNPSTNSLALSKQFDIEHHNVIKQIFKLAESNPSILMGVEYGVYESVEYRGGKVKNVEIVDSNSSSEDSLEQTNKPDNRISFKAFLHITENAYYKFVMKLGTPKSDKMRVYRDIKQEEYFKAFQKLRQVLNDSGVKDKEIEALLKARTAGTKELMEVIYDYTKHHNNLTSTTKQITRINAIRFVFNLINHKNKINAINYTPIKPKKGETRKTKSEILQEKLLTLEAKLTGTLMMAKLHKTKFQEAVLVAMDLTAKEAEEILEDYSVKGLLKSTEG